MNIGNEPLFSSLVLPEALLQSLQATSQTISQRRCLPFLMQGRDMVCVGFSESAPAASSDLAVTYLVPALCKIDVTQSAAQILILVPNIEWEESVKSTACTLAAPMHIQSSAATSLLDQSQADPLARQHIVIGVPEQIRELLAKNILTLENLRMLVLHNVVEMDGLCDILAAVPRTVQCCAFCTSRELLHDRITRIMHDEICIFMNQPTLSLETSRHFYVAIERQEWKLDTLCDIFETLDHPYVVYCNTRRMVDFVSEQLGRRDFICSSLHTDLSVQERERTLSDFRSGTVRILLVRGSALRLCDVSMHRFLIINYDLPTSCDEYLLRTGRPPARFLRKGAVINFVTNTDVRQMKDIEKHFAFSIEEMPMDIEELI